ncbi:hypothetical protein [Bacillus cereus group sp. BfR-BA-01326]|uniref:hypothetical protein n=1 Tax=Bacillus cereus group sp. BfR-BA-01326 TaxID=2920302 RepID=UPI001F5913C1|nr:hypothetical protein [Bacillus cereus group sp. BfR-BA-01326]
MKNNNEDDEIKEFKTISLLEALEIQKAERKQKKEEFYAKLAELKAKTAALKKQLNYDQKKKRT